MREHIEKIDRALTAASLLAPDNPNMQLAVTEALLSLRRLESAVLLAERFVEVGKMLAETFKGDD